MIDMCTLYGYTRILIEVSECLIELIGISNLHFTYLTWIRLKKFLCSENSLFFELFWTRPSSASYYSFDWVGGLNELVERTALIY